MQHDEPLALLAIRHAGNDKFLLGRAGKLVKFFFDLDVRHHFAGDFAEAAQPVGDCEEAVLVLGGDIAGDVPAVLQHFRGFFRLAEIALHHVGASHEQQAGRSHRQNLARFRIHDAHADSRQRMADASAFRAHLPESGSAKIAGVDGDHRRTFRRAVAFERPDAEAIFEGERQPLRQFLRAHHHKLEAAEIFRRTAAQICLQKCRRRKKKGYAIVADKLAHGGEVERAGMVSNAAAEHGGQPERHREAEGMKKRQHAEQHILVLQA